MPKIRREINAPKRPVSRQIRTRGQIRKVFPFNHPPTRTYLPVMNYLLAILLPPLSIVLTGRPIIGIIVFFIWIPALMFSGGLTHPMFILLAWALIFHAREDRRQRF